MAEPAHPGRLLIESEYDDTRHVLRLKLVRAIALESIGGSDVPISPYALIHIKQHDTDGSLSGRKLFDGEETRTRVMEVNQNPQFNHTSEHALLKYDPKYNWRLHIEIW
jgi:hypothetical protein